MKQIRSDSDTISNNGFLWTDIQKPTNEKMTLLAKNYNFHELNVEDCLSEVHIPKVDTHTPFNTNQIVYNTSSNPSRY